MSTEPTSSKDDGLGIVFNTNFISKEDPPHTETRAVPQSSTPITESSPHLGGQGVFDVERAFTSKNGDEGVIISDRKYHRPSVGESLAGAWQEWWSKTQKNISHLAKGMPKISEGLKEIQAPKTRVEIIASASEHATMAPRDDHEAVLEKFRTRETADKRITGSPIIIAPEVLRDEHGSWTHTIIEEEPSFTPKPITQEVRERIILDENFVVREDKHILATLVREKEEEHIPATFPEVKAHDLYNDVKNTLSTVPRTEHGSTHGFTESHTKPSFTEALNWRETSQAEKKFTSSSVAKPAIVPESPVEHYENRTAKISSSPIPSSQTLTSHGSQELFHKAKQTLPGEEPEIANQPEKNEIAGSPVSHTSLLRMHPWVFLTGIVLIGATLAVVASVYVHVFNTTKPSQPIPRNIDAFFAVDTKDAFSLRKGNEDVLTALSESMAGASSVTQFYPTIVEGSETRPATAREFFSRIHASLNESALRVLDQTFMIGSLGGEAREPFIILRTSRFDVLFVGLLAWEGSMQAELSPLFGASLTGVFFSDTIIKNKPVRILKDSTGTIILLYTFINDSTVIITSSSEALSELISKF